MKKFLGVFITLSLVFILAACGDNLEERVFEAEEMGIQTTLTYYHDDDRVVKQSAKNVIAYDTIGLSSKEEAEELLGAQADEYEGIDGLEHSLTFNDSEAVEELEIDYDNVDYEAAKELPGMMFEGDPEENDISMKESAEMLTQQGFTEKE